MAKNTYYKTCPLCGANLDPGEMCDCKASLENPKITYLCDKRACNPCSNTECRHTTDITHAVNFKSVAPSKYAEQDRCVCCGKEVPEGRQVCPTCEMYLVNG